MLRLGIIGSGFGLYGLLPAFNSIKDCKVVSICGKNDQRLLNYCKSIGLSSIYTDWELMIEKENLNALAIAVTPQAQYKIAKSAIKKKLDLFLEKPLASTRGEAEDLFKMVKDNNIVTAMDFIFPEIDEWQEIKKIIINKTYGKLNHISVNWNFLSYDIKNDISSWKLNPNLGGGALAYYFSHTLYYLGYFAGEISDIKSFISNSANNKDWETGTDMIIKFKNGVRGNAYLSCNAVGINTHKLIFEFDEATVILENMKDVVGSFKIFVNTKESNGKELLKKENLKITKPDREDERVAEVSKIAQRFVSASLSKRKMKPSIEDGVRVQMLIERIRENN